MLNPSEFIPVAEESDLIVKLGSYVLMRSVEQAAKWQKELPRTDNPLFVSVNVSSKQIFRQDLIQEIRHIVGRAIVPDGALRLEITESLVMENPEQATEILDLLKSAGARLALDDFGAGYSSLTYLERFPFDTIKVDGDLMQASEDDGHGSAIVRSIVALSHELGKKVVVEGVETPEDVGFLRSIGCEYAQGFYYGEPMPEREITDILRIVRKSERRLQRRGFFRTKRKDKGKNEGVGSTQWPPPGSPRPSQEKKVRALPPKQSDQAGEGQRSDGLPPDAKQAARSAERNAAGNGQAAARKEAPQFKSAGMRTRRRGETPQDQSGSVANEPRRMPPQQRPATQPPNQPMASSKRDRPAGTDQPMPRVANGNGTRPTQPPTSPANRSDRPSPPLNGMHSSGNGKLPHEQPRDDGRGAANGGVSAGPPPLPHQSPAKGPPELPTSRPGATNRDQGSGLPPFPPREDPPTQPRRQPMPDLSNLPPGIAASLAKLAGVEEN